MYRVLTLSTSCALILCIIAWVIAIAAFVASLFLWYKTGDYPKFLLVDYVSENWISKVTASWPGIQKTFFWILNRTIPLLFAALGLVMMMIFLIMSYGPKILIDETYKKEEDAIKNLRRKEKSERIKKLTRL